MLFSSNLFTINNSISSITLKEIEVTNLRSINTQKCVINILQELILDYWIISCIFFLLRLRRFLHFLLQDLINQRPKKLVY